MDPNEHSSRVRIGDSVRRKEDRRLLCGAGRYSDDVSLPGQAYAFMVRSPHAHARILAIDVRDAKRTPGVLLVLTGRNAVDDGLQCIPHTPVGFSGIAKAVDRDGVRSTPLISHSPSKRSGLWERRLPWWLRNCSRPRKTLPSDCS